MKRRPVPIGALAGTVQRLAVLLAAGVPPPAAWGYLREGERAASIASAALHGTPIAEAILVRTAEWEQRSGGKQAGASAAEADGWRGLGAAWQVATEMGAPLAPTLRSFAVSLRSLAQAQRDIEVALAAPRATARLVLALPVVGVLFGLALGFDTLGTLFGTPVGWACVAVGTALLLLAARWNRRLIDSAQPQELTPGLELDLMAIAVSGGGSLERARTVVDAALSRFALLSTASALESILDLSQRAGVPAASLLRSEAEECRLNARADVQRRVQALSVRLMLPLGLCVLPAFMVLGVFPLLVAVVTSTSVEL